MTDLGNLGNGYATRPHGINELSQVTGTSSITVSSSPQLRAFYWDPGRGARNMLNLGTLGGTQSRAEGDNVFHELSWDVNNESGAIAGYSYPRGDKAWHAALWVPNDGVFTLYDLNSASVTPNKGPFAELYGAAAITDGGAIIGYARMTAKVKGFNQSHGFLARPVTP
jgi:probable HAF family extracellular repeat protein